MGYTDPDEQREYQREWNARRRSAWFTGRCCVQCGSTDRLELDHIDPATKVSHSIWCWKLERRLVELAKCQVLCHECHLAKTALYRRPAHGKVSRYDRYKCRCILCCAAKKVASARYRKPKRSDRVLPLIAELPAQPTPLPTETLAVTILHPGRVLNKPSGLVDTLDAAGMLGMSVAELRHRIRAGRFPRPYRSAANGPLWRVAVIEGLLGDEDLAA